MSGGSYNYLCYADDLWELSKHREDLEAMHDRLAELPWAKTAADETARLLGACRILDSRIRNAQPLRDVWRAVEWWDSCDTSEDATRKALRDYEDLLP